MARRGAILARNPTSLSADQLHYLRKVLGVEHFLRSESSPRASAPVLVQGDSASARLLILVPLLENEFPLSADLDELLKKMIRAMKLELTEVCVLSWNFAAEALPQIVCEACRAGAAVLVFGSQAASQAGVAVVPGEWCDWEGARVMSTHSLREVAGSTELKRLTWVHLQSVMKALG